MNKIKYEGPERRTQAIVFGCLQMHYRDVGLFFRGIFEVAEDERQKLLKEIND